MSPTDPATFKLLRAFENLFQGKVYKHRDSSLGNFVAAHLYEDLLHGGHSPKFKERVEAARCVVNVSGAVRGILARRGDGNFGRIVPKSPPSVDLDFDVQRGMVALTEIGTEVKILAKSQIKQIDRVITDLVSSAKSLKTKSSDAITAGIAGVNYSAQYTGWEGTRDFPIDRKPEAAIREAEDTSRRLLQYAAPAFDEFVLLKFKATNRDPFPFAFLNPRGAAADYGAALLRIAELYEKRF